MRSGDILVQFPEWLLVLACKKTGEQLAKTSPGEWDRLGKAWPKTCSALSLWNIWHQAWSLQHEELTAGQSSTMCPSPPVFSALAPPSCRDCPPCEGYWSTEEQAWGNETLPYHRSHSFRDSNNKWIPLCCVLPCWLPADRQGHRLLMLINIYITVVPGGLYQIQVPSAWHILQTYWGSGPLLCYLVHKHIQRHIPLPIKNPFLWLFITCIFMAPVKKLGKLLKNNTTKNNMKKIGNAKQDWVHWELQEWQFLINFFTESLMCR